MLLVLATTAASSDVRTSSNSETCKFSWKQPWRRCRGGASLAQKCSEWRAGGECGQQPALMLTACPGVCLANEITCSRPPPGDYELELCAKLAARGECWERPTLFLAQCFRACAIDDPERMLRTLRDVASASVPFPRGAPLAAAAAVGAAVGVVANDSTAVTAECIHASPRILRLDGLVSAAEAEAILALGRPTLSPSPTAATAVGAQAGYRATTRSSTSAVLLDTSPPEVRAVRHRVANLTGYPENHIEPLQLVRYLPGQQFEPHNDWFDRCDVREFLRGGERRLTVLIYLNDLDDLDEPATAGGATSFPELGVRVRPQHTSAIYFENYVEGELRGDGRCLHQGEAPTASTKFAVNVWIRARPFKL
mgnify:CR=1 FL=1